MQQFLCLLRKGLQTGIKGKPVVVLSNNDGCVIARSNEAKRLGIPMGAPAYQYQKLFDDHEVHVFSANFVLYGDMSARVMSIVASFVPDIEIYSIGHHKVNLASQDMDRTWKMRQERLSPRYATRLQEIMVVKA